MAHFEKFQSSALGNMCDHYARVAELERGYRRENINPDKTRINYNLGPSRPGVSQVGFINDRIAGLHLKRLRKDAVRMVDCVVTLPRNPALEGREREFFGAVYATLAPMVGGERNVVSAWVHMDEARPHMHFAFVPVTGGKLSAKEVLSRTFLRGFHPALESGVAGRMGLGKVGLLLSDEERDERGGKYVGLEEYKDARDAAQLARDEAMAAERVRDQIRAEADEAGEAKERAEAEAAAARAEAERARSDEAEARGRLECVQGEHMRTIRDLESFEAKGLGELAGLAAMRGLGGRERAAEEAVGRARARAGEVAGQVARARELLESLREAVRDVLRRVLSAVLASNGDGEKSGAESFLRSLGFERAIAGPTRSEPDVGSWQPERARSESRSRRVERGGGSWQR